MTSSRTIRVRLPPMARLIPISRVRSAIDIAIVLTTDRPPTSRLISAIPTRIELRIEVARADLLVEVLAGHRRDAGDLGLDPGCERLDVLTRLRVDDHRGRDVRGDRACPGSSAGAS